MTREERLALEPLANIYQAYLDNELDKPRRFWGLKDEHEANLAEALGTELVQGRGGKTLLTLADCRAAHDLVQPRKPF